MKRSGIADLPLHGGRVPSWLASRMAPHGTAIAESVVHHYGRAAFLSVAGRAARLGAEARGCGRVAMGELAAAPGIRRPESSGDTHP